MSFVSLKYLGFFAAAAVPYWLLPRKVRKYWLLLACIAFYALAGGAYVLLLAFDTLLTFGCALAAERGHPGKRKLWTGLGVGILLASLVLFKYASFLWEGVLHLGALPLPDWTLPLGISFYTFSICGYLFDVGNGKQAAETNLTDYALFAAFFPTLPSGPVNRAALLLPQLKDLPDYDADRMRRGFLRFILGLARKLVAADNIALYVDAAYADPSAVSSGAMLLAALLYSFQIYLDFSACTDMACGCAEMLGITVPENFRAPYLSRSVRSFWKKWHISLTDWFRQYLYFPLGGSRRGKHRTWLNVLIVFAVSGLWHGAAYTFLLWGLLNGVYQVLELLLTPLGTRLRERLHIRETARVPALLEGILTFLLISAAWVLFRSEDLGQAVYVGKHILLILRDGFGMESALSLLETRQLILIGVCLLLMLGEDVCIARGKRLAAERRPFLYWGVILLLGLGISFFGVYGIGFDAHEFVYFQF